MFTKLFKKMYKTLTVCKTLLQEISNYLIWIQQKFRELYSCLKFCHFHAFFCYLLIKGCGFLPKIKIKNSGRLLKDSVSVISVVLIWRLFRKYTRIIQINAQQKAFGFPVYTSKNLDKETWINQSQFAVR